MTHTKSSRKPSVHPRDRLKGSQRNVSIPPLTSAGRGTRVPLARGAFELSYSVGRLDDHLLLQVSVTAEVRCAEPALPEHALDRIFEQPVSLREESTDCGMAVDIRAPHRAAPPLNRSNVSST